MRKNNSLPDLSQINFTPDKSMHSGWTTSKKSPKYKFQFSDIKGKKFDIANVKTGGSVFPIPKRVDSVVGSSRLGGNRRSIRNSRRSLPKKYFSVESVKRVKNNYAAIIDTKQKTADDSDIYAGNETGRSKDKKPPKIIEKEAFGTSYLNPVLLGLIKKRSSESHMELNQSQLGTTYLKAMTASMNHLELKDIKVRNIKENEPGIIEVIKTIK